ncbi:F-box/kelch-repeat protein [Trifolium pratense]|uniref:F-box/kelch-repeat protein n=1 Tax=Trifolium pratense TaxID=57577 RepID=A0A2K3L013_TRIPR|nr:F-box/kelch-repeat protein [Trifolium pratense]
MAPGSKGSTGTITSPTSLPMELVEEENLCRLPVKILLQLRCICKSWKSLISDDPKFAKKQLRKL